jgi:hypothetical protein
MYRSARSLVFVASLACAGGNTDATDTDLDTDTDITIDTEVTVDTPDLPDLCINEYMSSNVASMILEDTTSPDWLELYNPTDADISLDGWTLSDDEEEPDKHALDATLTVPAGGFLLLYADADPEEGPQHLSFNMSKDGEQLVLTNADGEQEVITYGPMASDFSFAGQTDCCRESDCWVAVSGGTPGTTNAP